MKPFPESLVNINSTLGQLDQVRMTTRLPRRGGKRGVALIMVLFCVVLIATLVVAFLLISLSQRQVAASLASTTQVDLFSQSAANTILADLKQEIAAGSTVSTAANSNRTYAIPNSLTAVTANYASAVPDFALPFKNVTTSPTMITGTSVTQSLGTTTPTTTTYQVAPFAAGTSAVYVFPNLLKMSYNGIPFYGGNTSGTTATSSCYSTTGPSRASASFTTTASLNGRYISLADWNKPYFLPVTSSSDDTPPGLAATSAPQWIMVPNDGTTQTTFSSALQKGGAHPVIGRYAYMIYNEGGDLDVNAVGYPTYNSSTAKTAPAAPGYGSDGPTLSASGLTYPSNLIAPYHKFSLNCIDFKQLVSSILPISASTSDITNLTQLVNWRNYGSANFSYSSPASFFNTYILNNNTGFLKPWTQPSTAAGQIQTDQNFASRQELIQFLTQAALANTTTAGPLTAPMKNALNYFTTFSRALNRPSLVAPSSPLSAQSYPTPTASINPTFSSISVQTAFTRFNGSQAIPGEPLVLKRFPLSRLSWLTYNGPSASRTDMPTPGAAPTPPFSPTTSYTDLALLIDTYGVPVSYLKQGTAQRIYDAFGLSWVPDASGSAASEWCYDHSGTTPLGAMTTNPLSINTLAQVAALTGTKAREPDFVELLKAAILNGALGKQCFNQMPEGGASYSSTNNAFQYQGAFDSNTDIAILQIAANIMAQSSCDGYPPRIAYVAPNPLGIPFDPTANTGNGAFTSPQALSSIVTGSPNNPVEEVYGSKNTPGFFGYQDSLVQVVPPTITGFSTGTSYPPIPATSVSGGTGVGYHDTNYVPPSAGPPATPGTAPSLSCSGLLVALILPEIWNPYDPNCPAGAPRPTNFQIGFDATDPEDVINGNTNQTSTPPTSAYSTWGMNTEVSTSGSMTITYSGKTYTMSSINSKDAITCNNLVPVPNLYNYTAASGNNYTPSSSFTLNFKNSLLQFVDPPYAGGSISQGNASRYTEPTLLAMTYTNGGAANGLTTPSTNYLLAGGSSSANATVDATDFPNLVTWANSNWPSANLPFPFSPVAAPYWDYTKNGLKSFATNFSTDTNLTNTPFAKIKNANFPNYEITGVLVGWTPLIWLQKGTSGAATAYFDIVGYQPAFSGGTAGKFYTNYTGAGGPGYGATNLTVRTQYKDSSGLWHTYDQKISAGLNAPSPISALQNDGGLFGSKESRFGFDPRTPRWAASLFARGSQVSTRWPDPNNNVLMTYGSDKNSWLQFQSEDSNNLLVFQQPNAGWYAGQNPNGNGSGNVKYYMPAAALAQNDAQQNPSYDASGTVLPLPNQCYYADPDGIVRRASGGYSSRCVGLYSGLTAPPNGTDALSDGNPYATVVAYINGTNLAKASPDYASNKAAATLYNDVLSVQQSNSRPYILNRPFRSVAELGYVFSGTPWKNLDMSTPESGYSGLLEAFCVNESDNDQGLEAGKVDLNTRQLPVLQAILAGAYQDEFNPYGNSSTNYNPLGNPQNSTNVPYLSTTTAQNIAQLLVNRTGDVADIGQGPLTSLSDLVGKYIGTNTLSNLPATLNGFSTAGSQGGYDGAALYSGFGGDLSAVYDTSTTVPSANLMINNVPRLREAPIRALSAVGQTRVWNLMIDLIAQTGEFPTTATTADQFVVNAQHRYWLHVAIDRQSGQVLDEYVEPVTQ